MALAAINFYYQVKALALQGRVKNELLPQAVEQYQFNHKNGYPTMVYEVLETFEVTYNAACIVSLFCDTYEFTGGAHGTTTRASQTWNLQKLRMLQLDDLTGPGCDYREILFAEITRQIEKEPDLYFENYSELLRQTFDKSHFYCTPEGIVVYISNTTLPPIQAASALFNSVFRLSRDPQETCSQM
ncbi:MAG: DUF3298 and DUF4163 domain-containing protein [Hydrogeniiclostridium mannosilyticum]